MNNIINLVIQPIDDISLTYVSAWDRMNIINEQIYHITMPADVRPNDYVAKRMFANVFKHPTQDLACIRCNPNTMIKVHPSKDLGVLIDQFPTLPQIAKDAIIDYIDGQEAFPLQAIFPPDRIILTDAEMIAEGWYPNTEE
jgi:hypothetical protein